MSINLLKLFENATIRNIIRNISVNGGKITFKKLYNALNISQSTLEYYLDRLVKKGLIVRESRGLIRLKRLTPYCFIFGVKSSINYIGLLGMRNDRAIPEPIVAHNLLSKEKYDVVRLIVYTSTEALNSWKEFFHNNFYNKLYWRILSLKILNDFDEMTKIFRKDLATLDNHIIIADCTSGPRPSGIALYKVSEENNIPLIYIPENERRIIWLISREDLRKKFNL